MQFLNLLDSTDEKKRKWLSLQIHVQKKQHSSPFLRVHSHSVSFFIIFVGFLLFLISPFDPWQLWLDFLYSFTCAWNFIVYHWALFFLQCIPPSFQSVIFSNSLISPYYFSWCFLLHSQCLPVNYVQKTIICKRGYEFEKREQRGFGRRKVKGKMM